MPNPKHSMKNLIISKTGPQKNVGVLGSQLTNSPPNLAPKNFEASEVNPNFHTPNLGRLKRHWQVLHHSVSAQSLTIVPSWQSLGNNTTTSTVSLKKLLKSGSIEMPIFKHGKCCEVFLEFKITAGVGSFTSQITWTNIFQNTSTFSPQRLVRFGQAFSWSIKSLSGISTLMTQHEISDSLKL